MSTVLAQPTVLFPIKSPTDWLETSTTGTSSTSSIPASAVIPARAPIASIAVDIMSAESRDALMHTASTQTDNGVLSWATGPAANRANDRSYLQGQAEKSGQESDLDSPLPKPKHGAGLSVFPNCIAAGQSQQLANMFYCQLPTTCAKQKLMSCQVSVTLAWPTRGQLALQQLLLHILLLNLRKYGNLTPYPQLEQQHV